MKKQILYLALLSMLFTPACKKGSCIRGVVLDAKTGGPVSGASVHLRYEYQEMGSLRDTEVSVRTNQSGEFSYSADEKNSFTISVWEVLRTGYSPVFTLESQEGDCRDVTIKLPPLDGTLKLMITNESGIYDSIYAGVFSKCQYQPYFYGGNSFTQPFPLTLKKGETYLKSFGCCVGDSSAVRWRFTKNDPWLRIDSFFVETSDTLLYEIKY